MTTKLQLGPISIQRSVRVSVLMSSSLKADLERYASLYSQTWGSAVTVAALIPHILETFIARDRAFKRAVAACARP
jgi:hypothetical protein